MEQETAPPSDADPRPDSGTPEREEQPCFAITSGPDLREWQRVITMWPGPRPVHFMTDAGHYVVDIEKLGRTQLPEAWLFSGSILPPRDVKTLDDDRRVHGNYSPTEQTGSFVYDP